MIGFLQGQIIAKHKSTITLLCGQVGYEIHLNSELLLSQENGQEKAFFIHTKVSEDDIRLFGFEKQNDLEFFRLVLSVNGVGPKTALEILSQNTDQVKNAIMQENAAFLSKIPGIGKKTAERIILDLKGKVQPESYQELSDGIDQSLEEVIAALMGLGYQRSEVYRIMRNLPAEIISTEEKVTFFLRNI